jgi:hypothetical protein
MTTDRNNADLYKGRYPAPVSCGGRTYAAYSREQLQTIVRILADGRFGDADRLFYRWVEPRDRLQKQPDQETRG